MDVEGMKAGSVYVEFKVVGMDEVEASERRLKAGAVDADKALTGLSAKTQQASVAATNMAKATQQEAAAIAAGSATINQGTKALGGHAAGAGAARMAMMEFSHSARATFEIIASGSSPLRALALEGPRLASVLGSNPGGLAGSLGAIGPALVPIAIGAGAAALGVAGLTSALDKSTGKNITFMETVKALFMTIGDGVTKFLGPAAQWVATQFNRLVSFVAPGVKAAVNAIVGGFVGAYTSIRDTWALLPAAMGDLVLQAVNSVIGGLQTMINSAIDLVNKNLLEPLQSMLKAANIDMGIGSIGKVDFGKGVDNPYAGSADKVAGTIGSDFSSAMKPDYAGAAYGDLEKNALKAFDDDNKPSKAAERLAKRFTDMMNSAKSATSALLAQGQALGLSAGQAAALEQKTKLLNEAREAGIKLSPAQRQAIDDEASAYARAKDQLDRLTEAYNTGKDVFQGFFSDLTSNQRKGETFWQSFADAGVSALDKLEDKIIDTVTSQAWDSLWSGGSTGSGSGAGGGIGGWISALLGIGLSLIPGGAGAAALGRTVAPSTFDFGSFLSGKATGGPIRGSGSGTSDSIPTMLSNGEFVVNANAASKHAGLLDWINQGGDFMRRAAGGPVMAPGGGMVGEAAAFSR